MKERPILFSAPMVRAILAGTKTQTRRALRLQPDRHHWESMPGYELKRSKIVTIKGRSAVKFAHSIPQNREWETALDWFLCQYGQPGDRLWVRESWMPDPPCDGTWAYTAWAGCTEGRIAGVPDRFRHPAFCNYASDWLHGPVRWTPSIHMPRWASRITLEITDVRVDRLQDISEVDAAAEGVEQDSDGWFDYLMPQTQCCDNPKDSYRTLWESINGPGSWDANPWVWCVSFRRVDPLTASPLGAAK